MKKILAILLTMIVLATMFIGCKKEEESKPVNATEPITVETVDEIIDNLTEDISIEDTTKDENGNDVVVGKDKDGNTVEVKTDKDGKVTKTITDKDTGKKTEQTTAVTTTKKQETTTKKSQTKTETTTKKSENKTTTTKPSKKPAQQTTTTKPNSTTTTVHKHDYKPVYKTEKVKVKDAYDEPVYKEVQAFYCSGCGIECVTESMKYGMTAQQYHTKHATPKMNKGAVPLCPKASDTNAPNMTSGKSFNKPMTVKIKTGTVHHDAVYEDRKVVDYYKCSCGATKK